MAFETQFIPKYQEIARQLRSRIAGGQFQLGDQLPTENELAKQYNVSRQTIRQALSLLMDEGLVERKRGSGTYLSRLLPVPIKNMSIAVIKPFFSDYIAPAIIHGLEEELSKNGYTMSLSATHNRVCEERWLLENLSDKPFDGLIVEGTRSGFPNPNINYYQRFLENGVPIVFMHNYYPELRGCVSVVMDDYGVGRRAVERLYGQGHKCITGIFKSDDMQGQQRYLGFIKGLVENGLEFDDNNIFWYTTETKDIFFAAVSERFLDSLKRSTAVVCNCDEFAVLLLRYLQKPGAATLTTPDGLAVVSVDHSAYCDLIGGDFFSFSFDKQGFGRLAAQKIIALASGNTAKSEVVPWN